MALHRFGLISDTHGSVHLDIHKIFAGVEEIVHAGDVGGDQVLDELQIIAAVHAVAGNVDYTTEALPIQRIVELPFGKVAIAHGHRHPENKEARVKSLVETYKPKDVRIIMHGHSHQQYLEFRQGLFIVNPGAASRPRFGVMSSVCVLEWDSDRDLLRFDFQPLDWS